MLLGEGRYEYVRVRVLLTQQRDWLDWFDVRFLMSMMMRFTSMKENMLWGSLYTFHRLSGG